MTFTLKKTVPNPNGNPNFRRQWENLDETAPVKLPKELHPFFKELTTAINSGAISVTQLKSLCNGDDQQSNILQTLQQFEQDQSNNWTQRPQNKGEFTTDSPRWSKYNEFKLWVKSLVS